jgi:GNAT superfamily N-acetyltransferase
MDLSFRVICSTDDLLWSFMINCLEEAFPGNERRSPQQMAFLLDEPAFSASILMLDGSPVGIFNVWHLDSFHYIEHFAIIPSFREMGIGTTALHQFISRVDTNVIIEVEKPTSTLNKRRIAFYERNGFFLCPVEYVQPPYDRGKEAVPLHLMMYGVASAPTASDGEKIKQLLYERVYRGCSIVSYFHP